MFGQNEKLIVGFDISDSFSQISYYSPASDTVETISSVAGSTIYNIPTVLCKRSGVNQWYFGKEAISYAQESENILIENLWSLAIDGEPLMIEEAEFDPVALLTLFVKRCLSMLSQVSSPDKMEALMITCDKLDQRSVEVLNQVLANLRLKTDKVMYQSHMESFYYYMLYQPGELWQSKSILFDCEKETMKIYAMECNRRTQPVVAYIDRKEEDFPIQSDSAMLRIAKETIQNDQVSSIYLIGETFSDEWMKESLRYLCSGRRVFQGSNLYSKGACYGMKDRLNQSNAGKEHVFLGNDKLKSNVGMKILRRGQESYAALLDAGKNWFEAEKTIDFYISEGNVVELLLTSLVGRGNAIAKITLDGLKEDYNRLRMHLYMKDEELLAVEITDLGMGEIRPGSQTVWTEEIPL